MACARPTVLSTRDVTCTHLTLTTALREVHGVHKSIYHTGSAGKSSASRSPLKRLCPAHACMCSELAPRLCGAASGSRCMYSACACACAVHVQCMRSVVYMPAARKSCGAVSRSEAPRCFWAAARPVAPIHARPDGALAPPGVVYRGSHSRFHGGSRSESRSE